MVIGLTGGIACGKSTALTIFEELRFRVIDCDRVVGNLLDHEAEVRQALVKHFGAKALDAANGVDRGLLAGIVFSNKEELEWLEKLLHPRVHEICQREVAGDPDSTWVVEVPLLFEKNLEKFYDLTVCVYAQEEIQLERLAARGLSATQACLRIANQLPLFQKIKQADIVLFNQGPVDFLRKQIHLLRKNLNIA